jgi:hypothetical protein
MLEMQQTCAIPAISSAIHYSLSFGPFPREHPSRRLVANLEWYPNIQLKYCICRIRLVSAFDRRDIRIDERVRASRDQESRNC